MEAFSKFCRSFFRDFGGMAISLFFNSLLSSVTPINNIFERERSFCIFPDVVVLS